MGMDEKIKRKHGWFCHITVRFNSKGNFKIKENKYIRLRIEEKGETGEATELGRFASRQKKSMGWATNSVMCIRFL